MDELTEDQATAELVALLIALCEAIDEDGAAKDADRQLAAAA